jgi:hypothetical protein
MLAEAMAKHRIAPPEFTTGARRRHPPHASRTSTLRAEAWYARGAEFRRRSRASPEWVARQAGRERVAKARKS